MPSGDEFVEGAEVSDAFDPEAVSEQEAEDARSLNDKEVQTAAAIRTLKEAYVRVFEGSTVPGDADRVMTDLMQFCRGNVSTYMADPRDHALLEGRREVYQRIMDYALLDHDTLYVRYTRAQNQQ